MNKMRSFFSRFCHSPILRRTAVLLIALAWSSLAFCDEIHDAAGNGDLDKVKALLKTNPDLVSSRDKNSGATPLHRPAAAGLTNMVELLLANKADANAKDIGGATPLMWAAANGRRDVAELLLANKAEVNARDNNGETPLHEAAKDGYKDVAELLLANKADVNAKANDGATPLEWAAATGREGLVELLRQHGGLPGTTIHEAAQRGDSTIVKVWLRANPDLVFSKDQEGSTPLIIAAREGFKFGEMHLVDFADAFQERYKRVVELLLANHADVNAKDKQGWTALHWTTFVGTKKGVAELLLANKADVNAKGNRGETPLHIAAEHGHRDLVELLLANKADANVKDNDGKTPLNLAGNHKDVAELLLASNADYSVFDVAASGDVEKVKTLLKNHPDLVFSKNKYGMTPLSYAAASGSKDVAELLLANKSEANTKNKDGMTPLHLASNNGHKDMAELLLANKADVNTRDNDGMTPLHLAAREDHEDVAELLLANKAEVNAKANNGATPLHMAAFVRSKEVTKLLLANKAEVNTKANNGATPLHQAAYVGSKEVTKLLLANKADVNAKNDLGETPLDWAIKYNYNSGVAELLRQHGDQSSTTTDTTSTGATSQLVLTGISGPAGRRLAIINHHTFGVGDEEEVVTKEGRIRVKVTDIGDDSVTIEIDGQRQLLHVSNTAY